MAWCDVVEPRTLRECRIALGQSQAAFAALLNVSPESYRTWDTGRRATPSQVMARAKALATHRDDHALLPLSVLALLIGVHVKTLRAAARDGRLPVTYDTRTTFRRLSAEAMDAWRPAPSGRPGGPRKFSDVSIMTALMLRLVFRLPLRQTEGFLRSVLALMRTDLEAPDHTTLSRRSQHLDLALDRIPAQRPVHLIVDSTGLSIVDEGEWAAVKHGNRGKRGWKKRHFGVDRSGVIVAQAVTEPTADDATTGISLIEQVDGDIASVTADAAYDTIAFYEAACARGARVVVPPAKTASVSRRRPRSGARDRTITRVKRLGRRRWKKASGYQRQARVENAVFRYTSIIGDGLRARTPGGRQTETLLACNVLNRMTELGRPASYSIGR